MKKFIYIFIIVLFVFGGVTGQKAFALEDPKATVEKNVENPNTISSYKLISPIGNLAELPDQSENGFSDFVNLLIRIAIALAGAIAVITIIIGGVQYMGSDSVWEKGESKNKMTAAVGGLILLFCSYLILYTINPDLVNIQIGGFNRINEAGWEYKETTNYDSSPASSAAECTGGLVEIPTTINRKFGVHNNICKDLADRLLIVKEKMGSNEFIITATTNGDHSSSCHKKNQKKTGACVDIALRHKGLPVSADDERWGLLCEAVHSTDGLNFLNEASKTPKCEAIRKNVSTKYGTGPHLHVNYIGK